MKKRIKIIIDICMTFLLLFLMAYQVTGGKNHEILGAAMLVMFIVHNVLNYKWYKHLFSGKYTPARILRVIVNLATLVSIVLTGYSGIVMSQHVFTWLPVGGGLIMARRLHLAFSYWEFVMMSVHLGLHWSMVTAKIKTDNKIIIIVMRIVALAAAIYGAYLFGKADAYSYMFMKTAFAMLDYEKAAWIVLLENLIMMESWCFAGYYLNKALIKKANALYALLAAIMIIVSAFAIPGGSDSASGWMGADSGWSGYSDTTWSGYSDVAMTNTTAAASAGNTAADNKIGDNMKDGFVYIEGGTYTMGSPASENWRSDDETQHEVTVSPFYMSAYELTQKEYEDITGSNPSTFTGDNLPVDNVSWLDAVNYCNLRSEAEGLTPVYTINGNNVSWNRNANGYRLPTEAEWEYACRAGTTTPFNTQTSISADEANYYGHYPYDIEENYFTQGNLSTKPGEYRQTTVAVDSFKPNAWGLYNMHGNVSEWVWDYYGSYDVTDTNDPTGPDNGAFRVYRGGGWNDFAKNMRSSYRATLEQEKGSFNIGIRLVRNAATYNTQMVGQSTSQSQPESSSPLNADKTLIVYFSWGGNTRSIAREIQSQTGADIFEITLKNPYSTNYNTVLDEAQRDQNIQARPEINGQVENIDKYDTIILGYPNWWASIPMPIATFLESYDLSGKTIIPFCSHGGGRFGQSFTAIAKLAPDARMGVPLSIHYGGGSTLSSDIASWLESNR